MYHWIRYLVACLPVIVLLSGEFLAETVMDRSQIYVPILALFPFLYLIQGMLVAIYGGSLLVSVILTSTSYFLILFLFLSQTAWIYILSYLALAIVVTVASEHRRH